MVVVGGGGGGEIIYSAAYSYYIPKMNARLCSIGSFGRPFFNNSIS